MTEALQTIPLKTITGDDAKLGQVFINLLVNAANAIAPGAAEHNEVRVTLATDTRGWARVEVTDTGSGIDPATLPRIFDPFFTTRSSSGGTGLGLSICHGIVSALGGELGVTSELGRGSSFSVALPPCAAEPTVPQPRLAAPSGARRGRILVIDDELMLLRVLSRLLRAHDLVCLQSARAAMDRIRDGEQFDLIISDMAMPAMTGKQFYEALLAHDPDQARRVVFMCGGAVTPEIGDFLESVSNARIQKPFDREQIQQLVATQLAPVSAVS